MIVKTDGSFAALFKSGPGVYPLSSIQWFAGLGPVAVLAGWGALLMPGTWPYSTAHCEPATHTNNCISAIYSPHRTCPRILQFSVLAVKQNCFHFFVAILFLYPLTPQEETKSWTFANLTWVKTQNEKKFHQGSNSSPPRVAPLRL